jgi:uridine kinase
LQHNILEIGNLIRSKINSDEIFIIAIDGESGSGKSTFATALSEYLSAAIIEGDDFYTGGIKIRKDSVQNRINDCIDWKIQREVLESLKSKKQASWFRFDWQAFDGSYSKKRTTLLANQIVILEGVYSTREELLNLIDYTILMHTSKEIRLNRLIKREGQIGAWEKKWHEAEDYYFDNHILSLFEFDLIINNDG